MKHSFDLRAEALREKARKERLKSFVNGRISSPLDKIINTKEKADRFMRLLRDAQNNP